MKPNCMNCKHYFVTYDKNTPRGCRVYRIQSSLLPSLIVKKANNGQECLGYSPKEKRKPEHDKRNLNDPKYW